MNDPHFEWDEAKAKSNLHKHRLGFEEGVTIFNDPLIVTIPDSTHSKQEQRYISLGASVKGHILVVIHVERSDKTRLISCRKAIPRERRIYEKLNK
jgi:uncharacterized DUF497 family protein